MNLVAGVDLGTTGLRSGVFDSNGRLLAIAKSAFPPGSANPSHSEQDPDEWWRACLGTLAQVAEHCDSGKIEGLAVVGQNPTLICVDADGNPTRPAILWADQRAAGEAQELASRVGERIDPSSLVAKAMWVRRHDPDAYSRTRWLLQSFDYLLFRLTGHPVALTTLPGPLAWPHGQFVDAGDFDPSKIPPRTCRMVELVGGLLPAVARKAGLQQGTPVFAGTIDSFAAWIGTGTLREGIACNDCGTTAGFALCWERPLSDPGRCIHSVPHPVGKGWMAGSAMASGSNLLDWFARTFYPGADLEALLDDAGRVEPGCEGLVALPHLLGERAPVEDPCARGVFLGISPRHGRPHFARAVLEAVAFAVRDVCRGIEQAGGRISEIRLAGGGARSRLWNRIKAGVLGRRMVVPEVAESALLGSAMIAAAGLGMFPNLEEASKTMFHSREVIEPDPVVQPLYDRLFQVYCEADRVLKPAFAELAHVLQPSGKPTS